MVLSRPLFWGDMEGGLHADVAWQEALQGLSGLMEDQRRTNARAGPRVRNSVSGLLQSQLHLKRFYPFLAQQTCDSVTAPLV